MIIDYLDAKSSADFDADVCVVGAGAAGLAIAHSFVGSGVRVCVLESGGLREERGPQLLNDGKSVGEVQLDPATARLRAFGGSCNLWGGGCTPLAPQDFARRHWVPESGWPLAYDALKPYYVRAQAFCGVDAKEFVDGCSELPLSLKPLPSDGGDLVNWFCMRSPFSFERAYREEMARAANVTVVLHCSLLELIASRCETRIDEARIASLSGRRGFVRARHYVLACGGMENARILLLSNSVSARGVGNDRDLVGRYFMDHPIVKLGVFSPPSLERLVRSYSWIKAIRPAVNYPEISLADDSQRRHQILNCRVRPVAIEKSPPRGIAALRNFRQVDDSAISEDELVRRRIHSALKLPVHQSAEPTRPETGVVDLMRDLVLGAGGLARATGRKLIGLPAVATDHLELFGFFEQAPNRDSRITLGDETDALGQRKLQVDWRLTALDWHTYRSAAKLFGEGLVKHFGGAYLPEAWVASHGPGDPAHVRGAAHHLGTTRMSESPDTGVVDVDCRIHGVSNLYVAGSSVFPSGGWAFPTLTLVALGIRLADHLRHRLRDREPAQESRPAAAQ